MLWGKYAQGYDKYINKNNYILKAAHHVNEIYRGRGNGGFLGCNHFNEANEIIIKIYDEDEKIEWRYTRKQLEYLEGDNVIKGNFDDLI